VLNAPGEGASAVAAGIPFCTSVGRITYLTDRHSTCSDDSTTVAFMVQASWPAKKPCAQQGRHAISAHQGVFGLYANFRKPCAVCAERVEAERLSPDPDGRGPLLIPWMLSRQAPTVAKCLGNKKSGIQFQVHAILWLLTFPRNLPPDLAVTATYYPNYGLSYVCNTPFPPIAPDCASLKDAFWDRTARLA
jgi:hypothetical protein